MQQKFSFVIPFNSVVEDFDISLAEEAAQLFRSMDADTSVIINDNKEPFAEAIVLEILIVNRKNENHTYTCRVKMNGDASKLETNFDTDKLFKIFNLRKNLKKVWYLNTNLRIIDDQTGLVSMTLDIVPIAKKENNPKLLDSKIQSVKEIFEKIEGVESVKINIDKKEILSRVTEYEVIRDLDINHQILAGDIITTNELLEYFSKEKIAEFEKEGYLKFIQEFDYKPKE